MAGQDDLIFEGRLTGQVFILADHCLLTGRYSLASLNYCFNFNKFLICNKSIKLIAMTFSKFRHTIKD